MLSTFKPRFKSNSLFFRLLLSFMCIIIMFSIFQFSIHKIYIKNIEDEVITANTESLEFSSDKLKQLLEQIENTLILLYSSPGMYGVKNSSSDNVLSYDIYKSLQTISSTTSNKYAATIYLKDIFVYKEDYDNVLCTTGGYNKELFFKTVLNEKKYGNEFWSNLCKEEFRFKYLPCYKTSGTYYLPIVFSPKGLNSGLLIVALVDILNMTKSIDPTFDSNLSIYNNNLIFPDTEVNTFPKQFLLSADSTLKVKDSYFFKSKIKDNGIFIVKSTSVKDIREVITRSNIYIILLILLALLFGIIMSVFFTRSITNPVAQIIDFISNNGKNALKRFNIEEMNVIGKSVEIYAGKANQIIEDKSDSEKMTFFSIAGIDKIYNAVNSIREKLDSDHYYFRVVCFNIHYKELFLEQLGGIQDSSYYLLEYIGSMMENNGNNNLTFQLEDNRIITIVSLENENVDFSKLFNSVVEKLKNEKEYIDITATVSDVFSNVNQIKDALNQTINAYEWRKISNEFQIIYFNETDLINEGFLLTEKQEHIISNNFSSGNIEECKTITYEILETNYNMQVRLFHFRLLLIHLINVYIKCINNYYGKDISNWFSINQAYITITKCYSLDEFKCVIDHLLDEFQKIIEKDKKSDNQVIRTVLQYIDDNFAEDISLTIVADKLKLSSSYLSHYFKQETGSNFLDFVNQYRINKAKDLLKGTDRKISDISASVGFINQNSFARTFKKYSGVSPKEFRLISGSSDE